MRIEVRGWQAYIQAVLRLFAFVTILAAWPTIGAAAPRPAPPSFADVEPVLKEYCYSCHNDQKHKGDVVLDKFTSEAAVAADRATWEKVLKNVKGRNMPPENKPQPPEEQRQRVLAWLESKLFYVDCRNPDPGRVTIRRLNRVEYNHTIRDLVGVDFQPAEDFPADDVGYGFDNIGDVLSMPPVLLEKYLAAAEKIVEAAIAVSNAAPRVQRFPALKMAGTVEGGAYTSNTRTLASDGNIYADYVAAADVDASVRVRAFQIRLGDESARLVVTVGTNAPRKLSVRAGEDKPEVFEVPVRLSAGTNRLALSLENPLSTTNEPSADSPKRDRRPRIRTRRLIVEYAEVAELAGAPKAAPPAQARLFVCPPGKPHDDECARMVLERFATRAFRRPVTAEELARLIDIFKMAKSAGEPFERGIQVAFQAVLVSPHFLFRGEIVPEPDNPKSVHPVGEFALATRLSYFLWSSMPDDELFECARRGTLRRPGVIETQVRRMMKDPKARAFVENFSGQWLQTRNLWKISPDTNVFSGFNDALRADMQKETELFFAGVMREDRSILDFIDGTYSYLNARLAAHYGIKGVRGDEFQKVVFKSKERGGVLTQGSILAITSNPGRTSPVKRGKWVLDNLLGTPPPPPPPDVPDLKDQKELSGTLRQKLEQHRKNPNCASCHARMDPIGFGLENFDPVGVWRVSDGGLPIDTTGTLPNGRSFSGPAELRKILREQTDLFAHCLTEKMLTYALGRGLEYYDKCAVDSITTALANRNYKFSVLVTEIVKSPPFQMRRGDEAR